MNEQIRELAEQSGIAMFGDAVYMYNSNDTLDVGVMEKFAELIVRECAGVCESMQLIGPYKEVQDATLKDAVVQIKEHFGVKKC
jgi:hypothetical protein